MELQNPTQDGAVEDFYSKVRQYLAGFPQEGLSNNKGIIRKSSFFLWRPHNYRRQINVKTKTNNTSRTIKRIIDSTSKLHFSQNSHNKIIHISGYDDNKISIIYYRKTLMAVFKPPGKGAQRQTLMVGARNMEEIERTITNQIIIIREKLDKTLQSFITKFNLKIPMAFPDWQQSDNWFRDENFIKDIPEDMIVYSEGLKKVYGSGMEIFTAKSEDPGVRLIRTMKNLALKEFTPEIEEELRLHRDVLLKILSKLDNLNIKHGLTHKSQTRIGDF